MDYENLTASDRRLVQDTERTARRKMEMACEEDGGISEAMDCDCCLYCHGSNCAAADRMEATSVVTYSYPVSPATSNLKDYVSVSGRQNPY